MLERFFVLPTTVDRIRASWIADQIEQYVEWLAEHEYRPRSILRRVPLIVRFGEFARSHGARHFEELPYHVDAFAKDQIRKRLRPCSKQLARRRLHADLTHPIQQLFRVALPDYSTDVHAGAASQPFGSQAPQFFDYLQEQRGLKKATMRLYRDHLKTYEQYLRQAGIKDLTHLSTDAIEGFITWRSAQLSPTSLRGLCSALRLFFRYLYREQILDRDLSSAIEAPQAYRLATIPPPTGSQRVSALVGSQLSGWSSPVPVLRCRRRWPDDHAALRARSQRREGVEFPALPGGGQG